MTKVLTYTSFILAAMLVVVAFVTARSYSQLAIAVVLYPALAYFALKLFPRGGTNTPFVTVEIHPKAQGGQGPQIPREQVDVADIDKRTFIKLVGATGASFFLFSLLGRRMETLLFERYLPTIGTRAENSQEEKNSSQAIPEGYKISEIDDNVISFYGFTNKQGAWLIMREDTNTNSFRYCRGTKDFKTNWDRREQLDYDYYHNLF